MSEGMKEAEAILRALLSECFYRSDAGNLVWKYIEDPSIGGVVGEGFERACLKYFALEEPEDYFG